MMRTTSDRTCKDIKLSIFRGSARQNGTANLKRTKRSSDNKKLVFLSKKVLEEVSTKKITTGTNVRYSFSLLTYMRNRLQTESLKSTRNETW